MNRIKNICIINDDDIFTFIVKKSIVKLAICENVSTFSNGEEAINSLKSMSDSGINLPEIILLDINMPIMNGWRFLDEFSKISKTNKIAIYLISAHLSTEDNLKAKNYAEIAGILEDPTDAKTLLKITQMVSMS